jgi:hypothetical protein
MSGYELVVEPDAVFRAATTEHKLARLVTFPDIVGRDAPGKTGSAAKPALITRLDNYLARDFTFPSEVVMRAGVWTSTGTSFSGTESINILTSSPGISPPETADVGSITGSFISPRAVFSGVQYYIGFYLEDPPTLPASPTTYYFGQKAGAGNGNVAFDTTPASTSLNFSKDGDRTNVNLAGNVYYMTLPTAPLSLSTSISACNSSKKLKLEFIFKLFIKLSTET